MQTGSEYGVVLAETLHDVGLALRDHDEAEMCGRVQGRAVLWGKA